jgi:hypothetical protein
MLSRGAKEARIKNRLYHEACALADKMWAAGDDCIRHEMATYLKREYPKLSYKKHFKKSLPQ